MPSIPCGYPPRPAPATPAVAWLPPWSKRDRHHLLTANDLLACRGRLRAIIAGKAVLRPRSGAATRSAFFASPRLVPPGVSYSLKTINYVPFTPSIHTEGRLAARHLGLP